MTGAPGGTPRQPAWGWDDDLPDEQPRVRTLPTDELRELVLEAGLDVIARDGLALGTTTLGYTRVFAHLEDNYGIRIARASVHERIWADHADFRRAVVGAAIGHLSTDLLGPGVEQLRRDLLERQRAGESLESRLVELARQLGPRLVSAMRSSAGCRATLMAKALASPYDDPLTAEVLQGPIRTRSHTLLSMLTERLAALTGALGIRPRATTGLDRYASHDLLGALIMNLSVGAFLDILAGVDDTVAPLPFATGAGATADEPWTMLGLATLAFVAALFEDGGPGAVVDIPIGSPPPPEPLPRIDPDTQPARRTRQELEDLVRTAGVEVLLRERLDLQPESLGYTSVFDHIEAEHGLRIYRASVHNKLWDSHDEYRLAVLTRAIQNDPAVPAAALAVLESHTPVAAPDGSTDSRQSAIDLTRLVVGAELDAALASPDFLRRQAIKAALASEPESELTTSLRRAIALTERERVDLHCVALRGLVLADDFEVRPGLGISEDEAVRILVTVTLTAVTGAIFDQAAGVEAAGRRFPLRRDDDPAVTDPWPAPAVAARALLDLFYHPLPTGP